MTLLTEPATHDKQDVDAGKLENKPVSHATHDWPDSTWPAGHGVYDTVVTGSATVSPPDACTTMIWLPSGRLAGMLGNVQTMRASLQVAGGTLQEVDATNTEPTDGPNPEPTMVSKSPPVRWQKMTLLLVTPELQPASPVTVGSK